MESEGNIHSDVSELGSSVGSAPEDLDLHVSCKAQSNCLREAAQAKGGPLVLGHRGGFQPANSLYSFEQAKNHLIDGVELDIWLSRDDQLVVVHGGMNGELCHQEDDGSPIDPAGLIWNMDLAEIHRQYEQSGQLQNCRLKAKAGVPDSMVGIPTLDQVMALLEGELLVNIEVKCPIDSELRANYRIDRLVEVLHQKLSSGFEGCSIHHASRAFLSSFDHEFLSRYSSFEARMNSNPCPKMYLSIYWPEDQLPSKEVTQDWQDGGNIEVRRLNKAAVEQFHSNGQLVGAWWDLTVSASENASAWRKLLASGVDMIISDSPVSVMRELEQ